MFDMTDARKSLYLFVVSTRKKNGEEYSIKSVSSILGAIRDHLEYIGAVEHRDQLTSSTLTRVLKGIKRQRLAECANGSPTCKIPFVASLMPAFIRLAIHHYGKKTGEVLIGAVYLASHTGLRPSEWKPLYSHKDEKPIALASNAFVGNRQDDTWSSLDKPASPNNDCLLFLHTSKADPAGKNPARAISARPDGPHGLYECAFTTVHNLLRKYPPLRVPEAGILSGVPESTLVQRRVRTILALVADEIGIDRRRLVLHSLRLLIVSQLMCHDIDIQTIQLIVGWQSFQGVKAYCRSLVRKTSLHSTALHDTKAISPAQLVIMNRNLALPKK